MPIRIRAELTFVFIPLKRHNEGKRLNSWGHFLTKKTKSEIFSFLFSFGCSCGIFFICIMDFRPLFLKYELHNVLYLDEINDIFVSSHSFNDHLTYL